jgi:hypothetical protein
LCTISTAPVAQTALLCAQCLQVARRGAPDTCWLPRQSRWRACVARLLVDVTPVSGRNKRDTWRLHCTWNRRAGRLAWVRVGRKALPCCR